MDNSEYIDIFATKGIEYLVVILFLITLFFFLRFLNRPARSVTKATDSQDNRRLLIDWFYIAENYLYHQGHTWVRQEDSEIVSVGIDDFAQKLIGVPAKVDLPPIGTNIGQGMVGWRIKVDSKWIDMLSPINGEVIEINEKVTNTPEIITRDPYSDGWFLKVKVSKLDSNKKNLLSGGMVKVWMENTVDRLSNFITGNEGLVLQDGGIPVSGFIREISHDYWDNITKEFLLTNISK